MQSTGRSSSTSSRKRARATHPPRPSGDKLHAVAKFDVVTGEQAKSTPNAPSYTKVFGQSLVEEGARDEKIVAISAAMPGGTGVDIFEKAFPDRTYDVGIAEQHAVTFAAGMASEGYKPFCAIYSTFLQRGYDQVVHDVSIQQLPVRFPIDRAGFVGADGATHAGSFDLAYLTCLPGFTVMAAADEAELKHMVATAAAYDEGPLAFRYPRGEGVGRGHAGTRLGARNRQGPRRTRGHEGGAALARRALAGLSAGCGRFGRSWPLHHRCGRPFCQAP